MEVVIGVLNNRPPLLYFTPAAPALAAPAIQRPSGGVAQLGSCPVVIVRSAITAQLYGNNLLVMNGNSLSNRLNWSLRAARIMIASTSKSFANVLSDRGLVTCPVCSSSVMINLRYW